MKLELSAIRTSLWSRLFGSRGLGIASRDQKPPEEGSSEIENVTREAEDAISSKRLETEPDHMAGSSDRSRWALQSASRRRAACSR